jgi:ABC-type Fe3+-siderophore transport system permease subunit
MDYIIIRMFCSLLCGVILSQTGSLVQIGTRNVLASPSTLGFDGMAVLWCLIYHSVSMFFFPENSSLILSLCIGFPLFVLLGLLFSSFIRGREKFERIILLGLTFNLLVGALFSFWQFLFLAFNLPFPMELWFGHFRFAQTQSFLILLGVEGLILAGFIFWRRQLSLFTLGPGLSSNWKVNEQTLFRYFFIAVGIGTFVVITLFGGFSFLGLIFPIIARKLWFKSRGLKGEFILGSVVNGCVLMLIDLLCYYCPIMGAEVPVGLIATAVGAASLILLLWQGRGHGIIGKA